jgi:hypothetical protein
VLRDNTVLYAYTLINLFVCRKILLEYTDFSYYINYQFYKNEFTTILINPSDFRFVLIFYSKAKEMQIAALQNINCTVLGTCLTS